MIVRNIGELGEPVRRVEREKWHPERLLEVFFMGAKEQRSFRRSSPQLCRRKSECQSTSPLPALSIP